MLLRTLGPILIAGLALGPAAAVAAEDAAKQPDAAAQQPAPTPGGEGAASGASGSTGKSPKAVAESTEKGQLKNPYQDYAKVADEGHQKFMSAGCNGCHGGTGGGGMGPPLTNEVWIYGKDDDTLFRLIALGSDGLKAQGYSRKGSENVVGPMPPMGEIVKTDDDLWKIIAWIRSVNPSSASGGTATPTPPPS
jgi:mono/diheme cytochrome c family protein